MGVPMVQPHGPRRAGFLLLVRPSLEVETPSPGIFMGIIVRRCPINMKGGLKVIRRSRATLIFSMGVPMIKPQWIPAGRFPPVSETIPGGRDAISWYLYGDHSAKVSY